MTSMHKGRTGLHTAGALVVLYAAACSAGGSGGALPNTPDAEAAEAAPDSGEDAKATDAGKPARDAGKEAQATVATEPHLETGLENKTCRESCAALGFKCAAKCDYAGCDNALSDPPYAAYGCYQRVTDPVTSLPTSRGEKSCDTKIEKYWSSGGDDWALQLYSPSVGRISCCCE